VRKSCRPGGIHRKLEDDGTRGGGIHYRLTLQFAREMG